MKIINGDWTIAELLEVFPDGLAIGPGGDVMRTLLTTSHLRFVAQQYPVAEGNQGYLVVDMFNEPLPSRIVDDADPINEITPDEWERIKLVLSKRNLTGTFLDKPATGMSPAAWDRYFGRRSNQNESEGD